MQAWNVLHAALWKYRTQKNRQKLAMCAHRTTLSGRIFGTKAHIDSRKKLLISNISSTCPHTVNSGPLTDEICWRVCGTAAHFNAFRVLAALQQSTLVVASAKLCGVEQRAPFIFGRAAITLGIGQHSSSFFFLLGFFLVKYLQRCPNTRSDLNR